MTEPFQYTAWELNAEDDDEEAEDYQAETEVDEEQEEEEEEEEEVGLLLHCSVSWAIPEKCVCLE